MSVQNLYDFDTPIEAAFVAMLTAAGVTVATADNPEFQKDRPRVEVSFQTGAAKQSYHMVTVNGQQQKRNATWQGTLRLALITDADTAVFRSYLATIRNCMANWQAVTMNCHQLQNVVESGVTPHYKTEDGYYSGDLIYTVDFGIIYSAWAELTI